jgi:cbb3-type cytochrome oxidase subunit 1
MMDWFVRRFLKASLFWLAVGVSLGIAMALVPTLTIYRTAHLHVNLLGFVTMMIFGVAYHVIPRFTGHPLHSRVLAGVNWWSSNVGLALFALGFVLRARGAPGAAAVLAVGALGAAVGAYLFVYNLWRTIDGPRAMRDAHARTAAIAHAADRVPLQARRG